MKLKKLYIVRLAFVLLTLLFLMPQVAEAKRKKKTEEPKTQVAKSTHSDVFRTLSMDKCKFFLDVAAVTNESSGQIRIVRDSVIIISVTPFAGMEFFRIVVNKEGIILINRSNKDYCILSYEELSSKGVPMNYRSFEAMLTNRNFLFGKDVFPLSQDFKSTKVGTDVLLTRSEGDILQEFYYNSSRQLTQSVVKVGQKYSLKCSYSEFVNVGTESDRKFFPKNIDFELVVNGVSKLIKIKSEKVVLDKDRNFEVKIPGNYIEKTLKDFMEMFYF